VIGFLLIVGLVVFMLGVWMFVLGIRFLNSGRRAFDRYLEMTDDPVGRAGLVPPLAPSGRTTEPPNHRRKWTTGAP